MSTDRPTCKGCSASLNGRRANVKFCTRECSALYYRRDHRRDMIYNMNARVKAQDIPCDITVDDIHIPDFCPVLGVALEKGEGRGQHWQNSPSLDRIRPELGYTRGNVRVISYRANQLKSNASLNELRSILADAENIEEDYTPCV